MFGKRFVAIADLKLLPPTRLHPFLSIWAIGQGQKGQGVLSAIKDLQRAVLSVQDNHCRDGVFFKLCRDEAVCLCGVAYESQSTGADALAETQGAVHEIRLRGDA